MPKGERRVTVYGPVVENRWEEDEVVEVLIEADDGLDYIVSDEGKNLLEFVGQEVEVTGLKQTRNGHHFLVVDSVKIAEDDGTADDDDDFNDTDDDVAPADDADDDEGWFDDDDDDGDRRPVRKQARQHTEDY